MSEEAKPVNLSLQKKSAARVAAVQALYTLAITGEERNAAQMVSAVKKQLANNKSEQKLLVGAAVEPDYKLLESILSGVEEWQDKINERLDSALSANWKRDRMSPLLTAILQCSIFELFFHRDVKPKIVIDEYTAMTRSFFGDAEINFVHGALAALSQKYHG